MVLEKLKRWQTKTFSGSDAFCHGENAAAEPSSKSVQNLAQASILHDVPRSLCRLGHVRRLCIIVSLRFP